MNDHPILALAEQFAKRLARCSEVERFRLAEEQIKKSTTVNRLIALIKRKQKELVHAKHFQKNEYVRRLEQELDQLQQQLEHLPIVREYQQCQVEVNDLLQMIQDVLAGTIAKKINIETGGQVISGCGSGGICGCRK